ncbi:BTB/POZ domain-containing protein 1-like [Contarinia nasturtii]|uniref:BTB/POZ domain-containing protein 1-like n=1 Tax=Contarinia nasturtii TaxID=265458 RepID=UPI0012D423FE|nr:BTB/POZ domain-containing protein 1-like [Contarinia nasturtii]
MSASHVATNDYSNVIFPTIGAKLYLNDNTADFRFIFESANGPDQSIPVHKLFLVTASEVFGSMFNESWHEKDQVKIDDAPIAAYKEFLQFFYLNKVKLTMENIAKVMYLGNKYNVSECLKVCHKFIASKLTSDNVCSTYELAMRLNQKNLKKLCETWISKNCMSVFKSTEFLHCKKDVLSHILDLDPLNCTEADVFEACVGWVKAVNNAETLTREFLRGQLGDVFHKIRFCSMSPKEFATLIPTYGHLFSPEECKEVFQMVSLEEFQPQFFEGNHKKRLEMLAWDEQAVIKCDRSISVFYSDEPYFLKNLETTTFSIDNPVWLGAFLCVDLSDYTDNEYAFLEEELNTEFTIVEVAKDSEKILYNGTAGLGSESDTRIVLSKPVYIRQGFIYEIRMQQVPPEKCCTGDLLKTDVQVDSEISVRFHDSLGEDYVARGMVIALEFIHI